MSILQILDTRHSTRCFLHHYAEMVAAMFLGMVVLGLPADWLFSALGTSWSDLLPAMMLLAMRRRCSRVGARPSATRC